MNEIIITTNNNIVTDEDNNRYFTFERKDKDGQIVTKTIYTPAVVESYERMTYLRSLKEVSEKGLCIEISELNDEMLKKEGFKQGVAQYVKEVFGSSIATNTAQKYRKVGMIFGKKTITEDGKIEYSWKEPIDSDVTVTNLTQIIGLLNLPRDYAKLTESEIEKIFKKFIKDYVISGKIHLSATNAILRDELHDIATTINKDEDEDEDEDKNTENTDNTVNEDENEDEDENTEETARDNAITAIDTLKVYFKGNKDAMKALATLVKILG